MKAKWYFGFLLVVLTVFGIYQEQSIAPNQEIILKFANNDATSTHAQDVIADVKQELQNIEAENIRVVEDENGRLKITYYSDEAVSTIKAKLSIEEADTPHFTSVLNRDNSNQLPTKQELDYYKFDVFEIQKTSDSHSGFGGKFIVEHKQDYDRSSNPNPQPYSLEVNSKHNCFSVKTALKANKTIAIAIDNTSHNIPEVRAGPNA